MVYLVFEFLFNVDWLWIILLIVDILVDFDFLSFFLELGYVFN